MPRPIFLSMARPTRKNPRLADYDYANAGAYFVTICTHQKQSVFGQIESGAMELNQCGQVAERIWRDIPIHFPSVDLDEWVVMPNHIHGILFIDDGRARHASPLHHRPKLGTVICAYKSAAARLINQTRGTPRVSLWQRNYYEHVIRNELSLAEIREYIVNNPLKWELDEYFP